MIITPVKLRTLVPPKDDLHAALRASRLALRDGDIVAISSKVVSIGEGSCVPLASVEKMTLVKREAERYLVPSRSRWRRIFTLKQGAIIGSSGVDESNGDGQYVLLPRDPPRSAQRWRTWLMRTYGVRRLGVILTDSTSIPLRRGAIGIALAYAGIEPLRDYRGTADLFGRPFKIEVANLADMLASSAVLCMGEGAERTPVAVIRGAPGIVFTSAARQYRGPALAVPPEDDLFAPLLFRGRWKRGSGG